MKVDADEVEVAVRSSLKFYEEQREEWSCFRSAYKTEFWERNKFPSSLVSRDIGGVDDGMPFRIQANRIVPLVSALVANLFYRGPKTQVELPAVMEIPASGGRPADLSELPDTIAAFLDEWLKRSGIRRRSTRAYELALMYGASAFKLGLDMSKRRKGDLVSRSWTQAIPHWELVFDREADDLDQQAYRGHLRFERIDIAEELCGASVDVQGEALPDFLEDSWVGRTGDPKVEKYVRILEFYDLLALEQRFYVVTGDHMSGGCRQVGKTLPIPYTHPDGTPAIPIVPVILSNVPEHPMQGLPFVKRVYELNAEQNFLLTMLANKMRREAATAYLTKEGQLDDDALALLASGQDGVIVKVKAGEGSMAEKLHSVQPPTISPTIDKLFAAVSQAWSNAAAATELMQGQQGKYLSATEASLLAGFGEATTGDVQQRMADSVAETCRVFLTMAAEHMRAPISVRVGADRRRLDKKDLGLPWAVSIVDSASTPLKDMRKKESFLQVQPQLVQLASIAAGTPQDGVEPAEAVQKLAQRMMNYMQQLWALPESFSWDSLSVTTPEQDEKAEAKRIIDERVLPELQAAAAMPETAAPQLPPQGGQEGV